MSKSFRPGSMGAADQKSARRFSIGATIIIVLIALLCYTPFFMSGTKMLIAGQSILLSSLLVFLCF